MSSSIPYPFDNPANYTASDSDKIEIADSKVKLKKMPTTGQHWTEDFDSSSGITYDSTRIEDGERSADETFCAKFVDSVNGNYGDGTLTATVNGSASIDSDVEMLDLTSGGYIQFDADLNCDSQQTGCMEMCWTPNYSGVPATTQYVFCTTKANNDATNIVTAYHYTDGNIYLLFKDSSGTTLFQPSMGYWTPKKGREYHWALSWDLTTGATRLFIDGTQFGSTISTTGTRDANISICRIGAHTIAQTPNFHARDFRYYTTNKYTSNFTPSTIRPVTTENLFAQRDSRPDKSIVGITYTSDENANWSFGTAAGTLVNGATVTGGYLDCSGGTAAKYASYEVDNITQLNSYGAVRINWTPKFTGSSGTQGIFSMGKTIGSPQNVVTIFHSSGYLYFRVYDNSFAQLFTLQTALSCVADQTYEILVTWNVAGGFNALYLDRTRMATNTTTGTVDFSNANNIYVGNYYTATTTSDFLIQDCIIYHHAPYTGASYSALPTLPENKYGESKIDLTQFSYTAIGNVKTYDGITCTEVGSPRYIFNGKYWNGSAWVNSDDTYDQAASLSDSNTNLSSLTAADTLDVSIVFPDTATRASVDDLDIEYTYEKYTTDNPYVDVNTTFLATNLSNMDDNSPTIPSGDAIQYTIAVSGQHRYVTGGSATDSDGTYAQSCSISDMVSDIDNIISGRKTIRVRIFLHSADGSTTPELDLLTITCNSALADPTTATLVNLEGFLYDSNGVVANETIYVRPFESGFVNEGVFHIYKWETLAVTDSDGYFDCWIYANATDTYWEFKIAGQRYYTQIPDQAEVDFKDLTIIAA